jgi:membrane-associated phospholipid phosphatase
MIAQIMLVLNIFTVGAGIFYIVQLIRQNYWYNFINCLITTAKTSVIYIIISVFIVAILIIYVDSPVNHLAHNLYNRDLYQFFDIINYLCEGATITVILLLLLIIAKLFSWQKTVTLIKISLVSLINVAILTTIFKVLISRTRPRLNYDPWLFFQFIHNFYHISLAQNFNNVFNGSDNSMPSGHTISVVAVIMPFILYNKNIMVRILFMLIGLLIIIARIYTINHWLSDTVVGMLLGIVIGKVVFMANQYRLTRGE